jgi:hypothetical protein
MTISLKTHKMLWGRAANRCAFKECRKVLVIDATETDDESLIGEECHIVAESSNGPRGNSSLTQEQRDKYENLILLCAIHHKIVDNQPGHYSIEYLHQLKSDHEGWVRGVLEGYDPAKQRDDEYYADLLQGFCERVDIDNWQGWASWIFAGGTPSIPKYIHDRLEGLREWLLSRVWPQRYPEIESSLRNFRLVLQDFLYVFAVYSEPLGENSLTTGKFYQIDEWNPTEYARLHHLYNFHVELVEDLALELTRAANYVCDKVRERFFPTFRLREGVLLVTSGPHMDMNYHTIRPEYRRVERTDRPYPGLEAFKAIREQRDIRFGRGVQPEIEPENNGADRTGDSVAGRSDTHP